MSCGLGHSPSLIRYMASSCICKTLQMREYKVCLGSFDRKSMHQITSSFCLCNQTLAELRNCYSIFYIAKTITSRGQIQPSTTKKKEKHEISFSAARNSIELQSEKISMPLTLHHQCHSFMFRRLKP